MDAFSFGTILAYAAKINELRKADPEAFKKVVTQVETVIADVKTAMSDGNLSLAEALLVAADGCVGVERALRLAISIVGK